MRTFQDKVLSGVQGALQFVPKPVVKAMKSGPGMAGCVVLGGALSMYGSGQCNGSQAIAGVVIGAGMVSANAIPVGKLFSLAGGLIGLRRK